MVKGRKNPWYGCNILSGKIPPEGKVTLIHDGKVEPMSLVRERFNKANQLLALSQQERGWTTLTLQLIRTLGKDEFTAQDAYQLESSFAQRYPDNKHIKDKIRQQLQVLRDMGFVEFVEKGRYRFLAINNQK
jgi:type II restriction enzyme